MVRRLFVALLLLAGACSKGAPPEAKKEEKVDNAATRYADGLKTDVDKAKAAAATYGAAGKAREDELAAGEEQSK
ncbi:MAG: hypothetical protein WC969_04480 [Elusimicrobiota bacterium]|jgi:hypothetical protein